MNKKVIIIGASGHGNVVADVIRAAGNEVVGFLDDDPNKETLGSVSDYEKYPDAEFIIAIGDSKIRKQISRSLNCKWHTAIHTSAIVSPSAVISEGTVVMPNAIVNANAVIGKHCIINTGAIVEHDNCIGNYAHISVGSRLGGNVTIDENTWIGIGATIKNNIKITKNCIIGAGAVVVNNIVSEGKYAGIPAKLLDVWGGVTSEKPFFCTRRKVVA